MAKLLPLAECLPLQHGEGEAEGGGEGIIIRHPKCGRGMYDCIEGVAEKSYRSLRIRQLVGSEWATSEYAFNFTAGSKGRYEIGARGMLPPSKKQKLKTGSPDQVGGWHFEYILITPSPVSGRGGHRGWGYDIWKKAHIFLFCIILFIEYWLYNYCIIIKT